MTTAGAGRDRARGGAGRWVWVAAVALFAAFAVLLHHETNAAVSPSMRATDMSGMARMVHAPSATMSAHGGCRRTAVGTTTPHGLPPRPRTVTRDPVPARACSTARPCGVDVVKHMPPSETWAAARAMCTPSRPVALFPAP
ncbi:hypothetical protein ACFQ10_31395 [Streptomyces indonesiensis]